MLESIAKRFFGTANERLLKGFDKVVVAINALEPELENLSDESLRARTEEFRRRLNGDETLDDILIDAFATVREAAKRALGERPFDVQLMGGIVLHRGMIAEMKTGEGKTLVATMPVYLNALKGNGVHVVTVNDYLARRDADWMGKIYDYLGLSVGRIVHGLSDEERRVAYAADVTYGTNNEFGFDYLRDNMKFELSSMVQRPFNYAIVDEVDSILVDEARTPLIISGPAEDSSELYVKTERFMPKLVESDLEIDEKARAVVLTDSGVEHMERLLAEAGMLKNDSLYDYENVAILHYVNQALRAHKLFTRDTDYIVKDGHVVIVDEFTGRMMEGRRYSEGLHQALEAKEDVAIQQENQTLASITFQNYFRLYPKLAGMTGTAVTEASEFADIYKLDVAEIPPNLSMIRVDDDDEIYRTSEEKFEAILLLIADCRMRGQPVLVGTVSIEKSEVLASVLEKKKIPHKVLNARYHEQEAHIIAQAGREGSVTIATNMAGRGTDIQLGGHLLLRIQDELGGDDDREGQKAKIDIIRAEVTAEKERVLAAGGLCVLGTERHESRRIDNQLRGRSGRQGDPGRSIFFLSLEDDLMRIFGSERMDGMLRKLGLDEGEAIVHPWINKALAKAQQKVEVRNFEIRKNLLKFDDVMNDQRKVIYDQRVELMSVDDVSDTLRDMRYDVVDGLVARYVPQKAYAEQWEIEPFEKEVSRIFHLDLPIKEWGREEGIADEEIRARVIDSVDTHMAERASNIGPDAWRMVEKSLMLQILDQHWKDHLHGLDHLRQGIGLRAYGQRDPLNEYKREAFDMFDTMLSRLREGVTTVMSHIELKFDGDEPPPIGRPSQRIFENYPDPGGRLQEGGSSDGGDANAPHATTIISRASAEQQDPGNPSTWGRISRNASCPCGSGRKYKHCHGKAV